MEPFGAEAIARTELCGEARGTATRETCVPHSASGTRPGTGATGSDSALPGRSPLESLHLFFLWGTRGRSPLVDLLRIAWSPAGIAGPGAGDAAAAEREAPPRTHARQPGRPRGGAWRHGDEDPAHHAAARSTSNAARSRAALLNSTAIGQLGGSEPRNLRDFPARSFHWRGTVRLHRDLDRLAWREWDRGEVQMADFQSVMITVQRY